MTRVFDAPRDLVFDALTKPELLKRWFGPHGWTLTECEVDLRVGGAWRFFSHGPDGRTMGMRGVYREIARPERIAVHRIVRRLRRSTASALITATLVEHDGKTTLTCVSSCARRAKCAMRSSSPAWSTARPRPTIGSPTCSKPCGCARERRSTHRSVRVVEDRCVAKTRLRDRSTRKSSASSRRSERKGTRAGRDGLARFAMPSDRAFGVSMKDVQALASSDRPRPCARAGALGDRLDTRRAALRVRRRARARDARADGSLVPRLRQLGASATRSASRCSTARRTHCAWSIAGRRANRSSNGAPRSRCSPRSRCTIANRAMRPSSSAFRSIEAGGDRRAQLRAQRHRLGAASRSDRAQHRAASQR